MKRRSASVISIIFSAALAFGQATVADVVDMVKAGLPDDLIVVKLRKENHPFDLSGQQMVQLKKQGISDAVLKAMIDPTAATPQPTATSGVPLVAGHPSGATPAAGTSEAAIEANTNDPAAPHDSGIYIYTTDRNDKKIMIGLERAAFQGTKGNFLWHRLSRGWADAKNLAVIPGPRASVRVSDPRPEFYFYFEDKSAGLGKGGGFGAQTVSNPNQFALVKIEANKENRETVVGSVGHGTADFGTDPKAMIAFKSDKISPGVYRVVPTTNMEPGEYAFIGAPPAGAAGAAGGTMAMDIFDFGINAAN